MKNKQFKAFLLGLLISLIFISTFLFGALADRVFVIKPLDYIKKRSSANTVENLAKDENTTLSQMMGETDYTVADVAEKASESVVTVSIKKKQRVLDPSSLFDNFGFFGFGFPGRQQPPTEPELEEIQQDIGSGFVVDQGLIVTNKHVVSDLEADYLVVDTSDNEYEVSKIYRDPSLDMAILQVKDFSAPALALGNSDELRVGEPVIAIGTALGQFRHTVTTGVVSGLGRGITAGGLYTQAENLENVIQTDAAINPGNSGGPLINGQGEVIGVNVATANADNISFSIPINVVKSALENFNETGQFDRPLLGVRYSVISEEAALMNEVPQGAYLVEVVENSSAADAGLEKGDIITKFDGQEINQEQDLATLINQQKVGDEVEVEYWDGEKRQNTTIKLKSNQD